MPDQARNLTEADVEALAAALEDRLTNRFYGNLGRGLWGLAWKAVLVAVAGIAAYGSLKGH
jgi:hypothetical protein